MKFKNLSITLCSLNENIATYIISLKNNENKILDYLSTHKFSVYNLLQNPWYYLSKHPIEHNYKNILKIEMSLNNHGVNTLKSRYKRYSKLPDELKLSFYNHDVNNNIVYNIFEYNGLPIDNNFDYKNCLCDIIKQLEILHENDIVHGDIKPSNIVFHKNRYILQNFENSLMKIFKDNHCKKSDVMFASFNVLSKYKNKYPSRSFNESRHDDYISLLNTMFYLKLKNKNNIWFNYDNIKTICSSDMYKMRKITNEEYLNYKNYKTIPTNLAQIMTECGMIEHADLYMRHYTY